ncbi:MAG: hypothetical protein D6706_05620 [Chloroflexi bacterium]|nr:MAG: hypothetical protein D6706_05620 [Chloroflexota bacterium]
MSTALSASLGLQDRVWLALRFGWTLAEVYGRLHENPPPDTQKSFDRLFLSDLNPSPNERLWTATHRLLYLTQQLFPPATENSPSVYPQLSDISNYPAPINDLLERTKQRILTGRGKLPRVEAIYTELNQWSRQIWAILDAEDPLLAEAATLGARLADTFWQWRFPIKGQATHRRQGWEYLLKPQRITSTIRQVRQVEPHLPPHVGPMLRHSLWEWGIAGQLERSDSGQLKIAYSFRYNLRICGLMRVWRRRVMKTNPPPQVQLNHREEQELWKQLQNQMIVWERLVFNHPLSRLLRPSDWRQVRWTAFILYAFTVALLTVGVVLLVMGIICLVGKGLGLAGPYLAIPTGFQEQLTLVSTLLAAFAFLATQFRRSLDWLRHLYDSIYRWVMTRKLEQRSLRAWNGQTKSLFWIWVQRLLRAEDE